MGPTAHRSAVRAGYHAAFCSMRYLDLTPAFSKAWRRDRRHFERTGENDWTGQAHLAPL